MRITVFGRGQRGRRPGGSVGARAIAEAFDRLWGAEGKTVIDATNLYNVTPPDGFASNAEWIKSSTGPIENAAAQERLIGVILAIGEGIGSYICRFAPIDQL